MVKYCAVAVCRNGTHNRPDLTFFAFPEDHCRRRKWVVFCKRADKKFKNLVDPRICSLHFKETDVKVSISGRKSVTACPTIFDPASSKKTTSARAKRHEKRQMERCEHEPAAKKHCPKKLDFKNATDNRERDFVDMNKIHHDHSYLCRQEQAIPEDSTVSSDVSLPPGTTSTECQTDLTADEIEYLITELEECRKKITILEGKVENKKRLKRELNTEDMLRDDESVKFYTGLPNLACFNCTLNLIQPYAEKIKYWDKKKESKSYYQSDASKRKPGRLRQLSVKEEYLLVLCRLRLGILNRHLGDLFGVSESTISKIVTTWVCLLAKIFDGTLLQWPSREEVQRQFPKSFKNYPDTRVIIDATEFFIEKPTSPCAQKATRSDYKHHNTVKLLVGIAPNGAFTFISKLWSGSTSDRKIVQESGLIDLLEEGDHLMADRGFNIRDLLTRRGVKLNIPPFSKGTVCIMSCKQNSSF
ncbi:uncharacterized protein [Montipora capricornis]|uniref:uncharacterized protein n=1 Tax=Montipora capricornis TaxID=246305 RepID=UPI0035F1A1E4